LPPWIWRRNSGKREQGRSDKIKHGKNDDDNALSGVNERTANERAKRWSDSEH
jgi:hypothetical protein